MGARAIGAPASIDDPWSHRAAIAADAEDKIRSLEGVSDALVEVVWDPPWNPRMISEAGREKLGI